MTVHTVLSAAALGPGIFFVAIPMFFVWGYEIYWYSRHFMGGPNRADFGVLNDQEETQAYELYREQQAEDAAKGPPPTRRERAWGQVFLWATIVVCVVFCVFLVPHYGLIPIVLSLATILLATHVAKLIPRVLARDRVAKSKPTSGPGSGPGYSPIS